jgi:tetratricopeptide (TPR) repeat protein
MYVETLRLVSNLGARRPAAALPGRLDQLFQSLGARDCEAEAVEDEIWRLWMHHPHRRAAAALDRTADEIAAQLYDIAETRLTNLLRACPDFAEAWNKRATLYYLQQRDEESVRDIHRTLELEPRHFGALCGLAEILRGSGDTGSALFVFQAALRVHPHLAAARAAVEELLAGTAGNLQ